MHLLFQVTKQRGQVGANGRLIGVLRRNRELRMRKQTHHELVLGTQGFVRAADESVCLGSESQAQLLIAASLVLLVVMCFLHKKIERFYHGLPLLVDVQKDFLVALLEIGLRHEFCKAAELDAAEVLPVALGYFLERAHLEIALELLSHGAHLENLEGLALGLALASFDVGHGLLDAFVGQEDVVDRVKPSKALFQARESDAFSVNGGDDLV